MAKNYIYPYPDQISEHEFERPMIKYLQDKNINRSCWSINDVPIDVKKSFKELNFDKIPIVGQYYHTQKCDGQKCDLIVYLTCDGVYNTLFDRYDCFDFVFVGSNNIKYDGYIHVPAICNRKTIFENLMTDCTFFDINAKEIIKNYQTHDFDLYHITKQLTERLTQHDHEDWNYVVRKITDEHDFVVKFCCLNQRTIFDDSPFTEYAYVVVCKCITSLEFQKVVLMPKDLSDIIYSYVDFESTEPNHLEYFC